MDAGKHHHPPSNLSEEDVMPTEHSSVLTRHTTLIESIKESADKLAKDGATRGDLKIISRALKELRYAFKVFTPYRRHRKITVFGSARTQPHEAVYQHSVEFGRMMAQEGWMVVTGAGSGIMEGALVGAGKSMSMGLNILLPFEQEANYVIKKDEKLVNMKYFFTRKLLFVKEVHAIALFPGGFGTQDEGFETLTLVQTGKRDLMPIVLLDEPNGTYWKNWHKFVVEELLQKELISRDDLSLYKMTDNLEEALEEVLGFYSVYNSMRFIGDRLVLRLHVEPDDDFLVRLNDEYSGILESGKIEKTKVHRLEADDEHLADLFRIAFHFDRKNVGKLRQMVDTINRELTPPIDD